MGDREVVKGKSLLQDRWDAYTLTLHQLQIRNAKPMIRVNAPQAYGHLNSRAKKKQIGYGPYSTAPHRTAPHRPLCAPRALPTAALTLIC
jgi:hypothetical protein